MKDNWNDQKFALDWDSDAAVTNPNRLALLELLTAIVADSYNEGNYILDLGAGSGLVEKQIFEKISTPEFVLVDSSDVMLGKAQERLKDKSVKFIKHDLTKIADLIIPDENYQIAITSFALHEIQPQHKREIFRFIYKNLMPKGIYVLVDRFKIDSDNLMPGYASQWKNTVHPEWKGNLTFGDYKKKMSEKDDSPDSLEDQLRWLREIGFKADCLKLELDRGLIFAVKV